LVNARDFDKALDEYLWLWDNMNDVDPSYTGVRVSFMVRDIAQLTERHDPAKVKFTQMRDDLAASLKTKRSLTTFNDWLSLNEAINDQAATLAWFDRVKDDESAKAWIEDAWLRIEPLLKEQGRWSDIGARINTSKFLSFQRMVRNAQRNAPVQGAPDQQQMMRDIADNMHRDNFAQTHMALLAANRDDDARTIADALLKDLDDAQSRVALVTSVIETGLARPWHKQLLIDADDKSPDTINERVELHSRLDRALKAR
jgi:hypothetical protein